MTRTRHFMLDAAMKYAGRNWAVLPIWSVRDDGTCACSRGERCSSPGKHPKTKHGVNDATTDRRQIQKWAWDKANVAIATGERSGLVVLDVDDRNGGKEALVGLEGRLGRLPTTIAVRTGGGWHYYFAHPRGVTLKSVANRPAKGIDVRAAGGYVVAPPSRHRAGRDYEWGERCGPGDVRLAPLPEAWIQALQTEADTDSADGTDRADYTGPHRPHRTTQDTGGGECVEHARAHRAALPPGILGLPEDEYVDWAISQTLPDGPGQRHGRIFDFARRLKAHSGVAKWDIPKLAAAAERWYQAAVEKIGQDAIEATCSVNAEDFLEGWEKVHTPGVGIVETAFAAAATLPPPAIASQLPGDEARLLATACREMQRLSGQGKPWFLSTRQVLQHIPEVRSPGGAHRILRLLERFRILEAVERGSAKGRRATEYLYVAPIDD